MHVRYCVECDEEFRPEIVHCSDCGGLLEDRDDEEPPEAPAPNAVTATEPPLPPENFVLVFTAMDTESVHGAAGQLTAAGIAFRVTAALKVHGRMGYDVLVSGNDAYAAMELLGGREGAERPLPDSDSAITEGRCPACGSHVPAGALDCPECQLAVGDAGSVCAHCWKALDDAAVRCPACGHTRPPLDP